MKDIRKIFNIGKNDKSKKKEVSLFTLWEMIIITIAFAIFSSVITGYVVNLATKNNILKDKELQDITDTYNKIVNEYYEDVDKNKLATSAIDGMMNYLNENYSEYMDSEETNALQDKLKGDYDGIGVEIGKIKGSVIIVNVFEDSPAFVAGIKSGDIIINVDGTEIKEETTLEDVTSLIKGKKKVKIKVLRNKKEHEYTIDIKNVNIPVVTSKTFEKNDNKIGYLYLETFSLNASDQMAQKLSVLENEGIDSLIIDLRGNTGGYLNAATDIASMFIKKGKVIYGIESKDKKENVKDKTKEERNLPIVVLVDSASASASEILAAALKESYGAILVGTKTYGKGRVQQTSKLSDDSLIKYTTAKWYTPSGDSIDGVGLTPGITVELTEEYVKNPCDETDFQLQKGIEILANN